MKVQELVKQALSDPKLAAELKQHADAFAATGRVADGADLFKAFALDPSQLQDLVPHAKVGDIAAKGTTTTTTIATTVGPETTFTTTTTTTTDK